MTREERKDRLRKITIWSAGIIVVLLALFLLRLNFGNYIDQFFAALNYIFVPIAVSIFVVYLIYPIKKSMFKVTKREKLSAILAIFIFIIILLGFFTVVSLMLGNQIRNIIARINDEWSEIRESIDIVINLLPADIRENFSSAEKAISFVLQKVNLQSLVPVILGKAIDITKVIIDLSIMVPLTPIFMYFFLVDGKKIFNFIIGYIPKKFFREEVESIANIANDSTGKYMRGKLISIFFLALFFAITFSLVLVPFSFSTGGVIKWYEAILYATAFALIMAILDLIPFIGPFIGFSLPILFVLLFNSGIWNFVIFALLLLLVNLIGQEVQKIFIEPIIMSKEVKLHPLAVLTGLLFFGALFGFAGFILATPIVATINSTREYFVHKYEEEEKEEAKQKPKKEKPVEFKEIIADLRDNTSLDDDKSKE